MLAKDRSERCTDAAEVIQAIADARTSEALRSSAA
jgi:hypothetical protein